jgi:ABC-type transport system involved in Fe-S cluster assembly fused permease/ATPase subunit
LGWNIYTHHNNIDVNHQKIRSHLTGPGIKTGIGKISTSTPIHRQANAALYRIALSRLRWDTAPDSGRITIDRIDIRDVMLNSLRAQIAVVSQDMYLFYGTIADNLRLVRPDATLDGVHSRVEL